MNQTRRRAAIFAADVAGYSRLILSVASGRDARRFSGRAVRGAAV